MGGHSYLSRPEALRFLQESAGSGDLVYRLTWETMYNEDPEETCSKGTFEIKITGETGSTGWKEFVTHPGYQCAAKQSDDCIPGIDGKLRDDSAQCLCDPHNSAYNEDEAKWRAKSGNIQNKNVLATDVGQISKVEIRSVDNMDFKEDPWMPNYVKINTNDKATGFGNGIYYIRYGQPIKNAIVEKTTGGDYAFGGCTMEDTGSHTYCIIKCELATCEKEMDTKLRARA